MQVDIFD